MMKYWSPLFVLPAAAMLVGGCAGEQAAKKSYQKDIAPILAAQCGDCHAPGGAGATATGLLLDSHENVMKGTRLGPIVVPGSAISSTLYLLISGKADPSIRMPHGKEAMSAEDIASIEQWIDEGAGNN